MPITKSELNQKWYYKGAKIFFWSLQLLVLIAVIYNGGGIIDIILGFALYWAIMIGIWKVFIMIKFGKIEKDDKSNKS